MLYSNTCEYAIRALTYLAERPPGEYVLLGEIAREQELPGPFLRKILHGLVRAGMLRSARGPTGGYMLAYPADEISLLDIRRVVDGAGDLERCAVGLDPCSDETPCPLHDRFKPLRGAIREYLAGTTVEDLVRGLARKRALLAEADVRGRKGAG